MTTKSLFYYNKHNIDYCSWNLIIVNISMTSTPVLSYFHSFYLYFYGFSVDNYYDRSPLVLLYFSGFLISMLAVTVFVNSWWRIDGVLRLILQTISCNLYNYWRYRSWQDTAVFMWGPKVGTYFYYHWLLSNFLWFSLDTSYERNCVILRWCQCSL